MLQLTVAIAIVLDHMMNRRYAEMSVLCKNRENNCFFTGSFTF